MKTTKNSLSVSPLKSLVLGAMAIGLTSTAMAGGADHAPADLNSWAQEANEQVDKVMYYPTAARGRTAEGSADYRITIDADGDILNTVVLDTPRNSVIRRAAKRVVSKMDLPDLPEGYDELTFRLYLTYDVVSSAAEEAALKRKQRVTTRQIADNADTDRKVAGVQILSVTRSEGGL